MMVITNNITKQHLQQAVSLNLQMNIACGMEIGLFTRSLLLALRSLQFCLCFSMDHIHDFLSLKDPTAWSVAFTTYFVCTSKVQKSVLVMGLVNCLPPIQISAVTRRLWAIIDNSFNLAKVYRLKTVGVWENTIRNSIGLCTILHPLPIPWTIGSQQPCIWIGGLKAQCSNRGLALTRWKFFLTCGLYSSWSETKVIMNLNIEVLEEDKGSYTYSLVLIIIPY